MWDKSSRGQQITILTDTLKSLTISLLIVHWVGKWIIIGQSTEVRLYNWIIFALLMTCSITEWLADLQKLAGQLKQQPPQGGSLAKKKNSGMLSHLQSSRRFQWKYYFCLWLCVVEHVLCVCVRERETERWANDGEWSRPNKLKAAALFSPMPQGKTYNDFYRTEGPAEKLHNRKDQSSWALSCSLSSGAHTTTHSSQGWTRTGEAWWADRLSVTGKMGSDTG